MMLRGWFFSRTRNVIGLDCLWLVFLLLLNERAHHMRTRISISRSLARSHTRFQVFSSGHDDPPYAPQSRVLRPSTTARARVCARILLPKSVQPSPIPPAMNREVHTNTVPYRSHPLSTLRSFQLLCVCMCVCIPPAPVRFGITC